MSLLRLLFGFGKKNLKVIPFNQMTRETHDQISSGLAKLMFVVKTQKMKLTKAQQKYILNQAKQVQEFEDRYLTGVKDKFGNIIKKKSADVLDLKGKPIDPSKPIMGGTQEFQSGIIKATKPKPNVVKTEAQIKSKLEGMNKKTIERIKRRRYEAAIKAEKEKAAKDPNYIPDIIDPDDFLAGGGIAGMLGEPTYQDDNHRVPLKGGKTPFKPPLPNENWMESWWKNLGPWEKISVFGWGLPFEKGGRVPMWMGGGLGAGKALLREMLKYFSKGSTHGKSPTDLLKLVNPKQFNEMLNRPGGIPALAKEMIEKYIKTMKKDRADTVEDIISSAKNIKKADDAVIAHKKWMVDDLVKKGSDRKTAEMFAEGMSKAMAKAGPKNAPKITEQGLLELQNIHKNLVTKGRPLNAKGGLAKMLGE